MSTINYMKEIAQYKSALHFLDECGDITAEKLDESYRIALGDNYDRFKKMKNIKEQVILETLSPDEAHSLLESMATEELGLTRKRFIEQIAHLEDKLRSMGANPYKKWWQFWK